MVRSASEAVTSVEAATDILLQACTTRGVDPGRVLRAMDFLEKQSRKGGKKDPEEQAREQQELAEKILGEWRLIFTTG